MTYTKRDLRHLRNLAALPTDNLGPGDYATLDALVKWAGDILRSVDKKVENDRAASKARNDRQKARDEDRGWWSIEDGYAAVDARSGGRCEAGVFGRAYGRCPRSATEHHHIAGRRVPDPHNPNNLWALCSSCHEWATACPTEAKRVGLSADRLGVR